MGRPTKEQKAAQEQQTTQAPEQEPATQAPEQEPEKEPEQEPATQAPEQTAPEQQPPKDDRVTVEVVQTYKDLELKRIVKKGERLPMKADRAAVIIGKKLGKAVED